IVRRRRTRSIVNETPGGGRVTFSDSAAESLEWELALTGLTSQEWAPIEDLFEACGGRASDFVFLDPLDNLLGWSEDLAAAGWAAGPMLERTAGRPNPLGTARATRLVNTGQAPQRLTQTLSAPGGFQYCLSARIRSAVPGVAKLVLATTGGEDLRIVETGPVWREVWMTAKLGGTGETITGGVELAPGASVDVFGMQLEAQTGPSAYKKTAGRGGVYPFARFSEDLLRAKTEGIDSHSTVIRITSRREGV
ncbi:MAG: hypothetical protein Q8N47_01995, partial [Bryobacterales bacterium]|nr:hypothetical protein [Bryobacterales bacterium]